MEANFRSGVCARGGTTCGQLREVQAGHDGTWVAHPALVPVAMGVFNEHMPQPNQISYVPESYVTAVDLLRTPDKGQIT